VRGILKIIFFTYVVTAVFLYGNPDLTWIPQYIGVLLSLTCLVDIFLIRLENIRATYIPLNILFSLSLLFGLLVNWAWGFFKTILQMLFLAIFSLHCARRFETISILFYSIIVGNILLIIERVLTLGSWSSGFGLIRYEGFAGNPNDYSFMLCLGILSVVYLLFFELSVRRLIIVHHFLLLLFLIELVFYAGSRAIIFGTVFILIFYVYYVFKSSGVFGKLALLGVVIAGSYSVSTNLDKIQVASRIVSAVQTSSSQSGETDFSTSSRLAFFKEGLRLWTKRPVIGYGTDMFRDVNVVEKGYYSHNNYIELLANNGILGFFLYYSLHLIFARLIWISDFSMKVKRYYYLVLFVLLTADIAMVTYYHKIYILFFMYIIGTVKNNTKNTFKELV